MEATRRLRTNVTVVHAITNLQTLHMDSNAASLKLKKIPKSNLGA